MTLEKTMAINEETRVKNESLIAEVESNKAKIYIYKNDIQELKKNMIKKTKR